jgi:phage protein D
MMRPNYLVEIGSESFIPESKREIISIIVNRNMGIPIDSAELILAGNNDLSIEMDDPIKVHLGYDKKLFPVFSGLVENIEHDLLNMRLTGLGLTVAFLRLRLKRFYEHQTAGKIVKDLAQEVNLKIKEASDGINFPSYAIDDTSNALEHIQKLADRCNFEVYVTDDEKLVFQKLNGGKNHALEFGKNIIGVEGINFSPLYKSAKIFGESPSSIKGAETFHWLTKKEVKGEAGSGNELVINDPAIRDQQTADTVAKAKLNELQYTFGLIVETVGNPEIKLGDSVSIVGVPNPEINGEYQIRSTEHYLSKIHGFISMINCWRKGS